MTDQVKELRAIADNLGTWTNSSLKSKLITICDAMQETVIPGTEDMQAREDWLRSKAADMGYELVSLTPEY